VKTKYFIITGSSKGIGAELSKQLLKENHHVFCISRTENKEILNIAIENNYRYDFVSIDLSNIPDVIKMTDQIFNKIREDDSELICLVNNAAVVTPIGTIDKCNLDEIVATVHTNMLSPILLTSRLLDATREWKTSKTIINISSGSGKYPAEGMSVYCSTKAAIDMFTKCISLEQKTKENPINIYSVDPGMVDTAMQETARNAEHDFQLKYFFVEAKNEGNLKKPSDVAKKIIKNYIK